MTDKKYDPDNTVQITKFDLEKLKEDSSQGGCLIIIKGAPQNKIFYLETDEVFYLGRDSKDQSVAIRVSDNKVSRKQAKITKEKREDGSISYKITDAGSLNGTFLNGKKLGGDAIELKKEDEILIGDTVLKFFPRNAAELQSLEGATIDGLTSIFNRKFTDDSLNVEFKRAKLLQLPLSLIVFDIDNFKKINDGYGHDAGDAVLKNLCRIVKQTQVRTTDILGRFGGEEFLLILPETVSENARNIAERIRKNIEDSEITHGGYTIKITISLGVSTYMPDSSVEDEHVLFKKADTALYESKHTGKNKVSVAKM